MAKATDEAEARKAHYLEIRERQDRVLALPTEEFSAWCSGVALLEIDPVIGLVFRLTNMAESWDSDPRLMELKRAEEAALDQLNNDELLARWDQGRLSGYQLEYWEFRRPKDIPRINGLPAWFARTLVDVVD